MLGNFIELLDWKTGALLVLGTEYHDHAIAANALIGCRYIL